MIVEMTSCTPLPSFKSATGKLQIIPATIAANNETMRLNGAGKCIKLTATAANAPTYSCPSAPILKSPPRIAIANVRAVRINGVAFARDSAQLYVLPKLAPLFVVQPLWPLGPSQDERVNRGSASRGHIRPCFSLGGGSDLQGATCDCTWRVWPRGCGVDACSRSL